MLVDLVLFQKIILSLALGMIVGYERETQSVEEKVDPIAGIRTFSLTALFGTMSGYFSFVLNNTNFAVAGFFSIVIISAMTYFFKVQKRGSLGQTSEIAFIMTFLIGLSVFYDTYPFFLSISLGIILPLILVLKKYTHELSQHTLTKEIRDALIFVVLAFIIFPLLPNYPIDPLNSINPYQIWLSIVLVLSISFLSYILMKIFGTKKGITFTGFFGG